MKKQIKNTALALLASSLCFQLAWRSAGADSANVQPEPTREQLEFFEGKIRPMLVERCYECHSADAEKIKGGLVLDSREGWMKGGDSGTAIVPGDPEKSLLIKAIRYLDEDLQMPPKEKNQLTPKQIADFEAWVRMGAPDPRAKSKLAVAAKNKEGQADGDFWAFTPVRLPPLPAVQSTNWLRNPIDHFILAKLEELGLQPAPGADKRTLVRRAYFDLIGLPPTPEQVDKFLNDTSPGAYANLIDQLLASKHYGERWGRHWLDVARYADSGGYETDIYYRNAWRYRDYVVDSFNEDKPYDRFVQEQVAGDELWPDNLALDGSYKVPPDKQDHLEARLGTGLYALGPQIHESNMDADKLQYETLTDWVDTTGAAFMGLTLGCARCHDHKFDPITQKDYFSLQAVFAGSKEVEIPLITGMGIADFKQHYPRVVAVVEARKAYRLFEAKVKGRELTEEEKKEQQRLFENLVKQLLAIPESTAHDGPFEGLMEIPTASVLGHERPELAPDIHLLNRGELHKPKQKVTPDIPVLLREATGWNGTFPGPIGSRKQLALWLTDTNHPLTARVMVNRLWHWHFGRGIVATPNDFGKMGEPPTHPELLDWLASQFMTHGWSIKKMHRLLMLSSAYQMDSQFQNAQNRSLDPANQYLWRMNRRRLEAEALWDAMHASAGTINLKMGGRPVVPPLEKDEMPPGNWIVSADPSDHTRRGIYILSRRNFRFPMFDVFDSPVNAVSTAARDVTTVAPQALWFLNNKNAVRQAQQFAARLARDDSAGWNKPDFGAAHPGWEGNKGGRHAGWAKRVDNGNQTASFDDPLGTVVTHGPTSLLWKAPVDDPGGTAKLSGGLWNIRHLGRSGPWKLWKNDSVLLAEGIIDDSSGSSSKPLNLDKGAKEAGALENIAYQSGDTFRLEILGSDFVGVNLTITANQTYDLAADFSLRANPSPRGWQYSEALSNGGGVVGPSLQPSIKPGDIDAWVEKAWRIAFSRAPTPDEKEEALELIEALSMDSAKLLENPPPELAGLPALQAAALAKFCLAIFNLNEFMYID